MRKNKFICLIGVLMLSLCGCEDNKSSSRLSDEELYDRFFKRRVAVDVYDENREKLKTLNDRYDEEVTLCTNTTYVFGVYIDHEGYVLYHYEAISFEYDEEYISLVEYTEEDPASDTNLYYFTGLKEVDETTLIIHHRAVTEAKTILITLVDSLEIDNE